MSHSFGMPEEEVPIGFDVGRALEVLTKNIFAGHNSCLRELIANAADSISQLKPGQLGNVEIRILPDAKSDTLTISDTGIGMTRAEATQLLGTIHGSGKISQKGMIGEFGIGFYSCFPVSSKVEVITRSRQTGDSGTRIVYEGGQSLKVASAEVARFGTAVILHLLPQYRSFLEKEALLTLVRKDCNFVQYPIYLGNGFDVLNAMHAAWYRENARESDVHNDLKTHFGVADPIISLPFFAELNHAVACGVLYVNSSREKPTLRVYSHRVLITERDDSLLDEESASFISAIVDADNLPLVVSRNALLADAVETQRLRDFLEHQLISGLVDTAKTKNRAFRRLMTEHGESVKRACLKKEIFRQKLSGYLPYRSSSRTYVTVPEYLAASPEPVVIYADDLAVAESLLPLYRKSNREVLFMTDGVDSPLRSQWEVNGKLVQFQRLDVDPPVDSADSSRQKLEKGAAIQEAVAEAVRMLFESSVSDSLNVEIRALGPSAPPSLLSLGEQTRDLLQMKEALDRHQRENRMNELPPEARQMAKLGLLDILAKHARQTLILNESHRLARALFSLLRNKSSGRGATEIQLARFLYNQALLASGLLLSPEQLREISQNQTGLIADLIEQTHNYPS